MSTSSQSSEYDVVVYGATGFVGRLLAEYLAGHAPAQARIALGGRSRTKLEEIRATLPGAAADWPLVVADAADETQLASLAASTTVVATTVGPYARYGLPLARACAAAGTHYADLTGEVLYVRDLADAVHEDAVRTGARIVASCGFDSVPSDLGVWLLHRYATEHGLGGLGDTTLLVTRMKGGFSGGTIDSMRAQLEAIQAEPGKRKVVFDPFALSPDRATDPAGAEAKAHRDTMAVYQDKRTGQWTAPFVMGSYNTRIVRRSNGLLDHAYGPHFRYREASAFGDGIRARVRATVTAAGMGVAMSAMSNPRTRPLADRLAPKPGEGPNEQERDAGRFRMEVRTTTDAVTSAAAPADLVSVVAAKGDPGYKATAVMLGESALCLAFEGDRLWPHGGVLTPAVAMGDALVDRLRAADGFVLTVGPDA